MKDNKKALEYFNNDSLATTVWSNKYRADTEETPDDMHIRLAKVFGKKTESFEGDKNLSQYGKERTPLYEQEYYDLFKDFKYLILGGSGMAAIGNPQQPNVSTSNCFVIDYPSDSLGSIYNTRQDQANLMKRRGGVGFDISHLRPANASVKNAAKTSTGAASFVHGNSEATNEVGQGGRRGALMNSIHVKHPDVRTFIHLKDEEGKISGANLSVQVDDEFMKCAVDNTPYYLRFPIDMPKSTIDRYKDKCVEEGKLYEFKDNGSTIYLVKDSARDIYLEIIKAARNRAEPGVLFNDRIINFSPDGCYDTYKPISTNPCFHPNTLVLTVRGWMQIKDIKEPTKVVSKDENGETVISQAGASFISKTNAETLKIEIEKGDVLQVTPEHKIWVLGKGWVEAKNIKLGDNLGSLCSAQKKYDTYADLMLNTNSEYKDTFSSREAMVTKISLGETTDVYDIQVEGTNCLIANNIIAHNCGEIPMGAYDSCRLLHHNLLSYVKNPYTENAVFDYELLKRNAYEAIAVGDRLIDLEIETVAGIIGKLLREMFSLGLKTKTNETVSLQVALEDEIRLWKKILKTTKSSRRLGIGFTALGDTLAALNKPYGDKETIEKIMHTKFEAELNASIDLSIKYGHFEEWNVENENSDWYKFVEKEFPDLFKKMNKYGRRHVSWSTVAPTGTVSIMTQTTSGIEPLFSPYYTRRVKTQGKEVADCIDTEGVGFREELVIHKPLQDWIVINHPTDDITDKKTVEKLFKQSPWSGSIAEELDHETRLDTQALIQKYTTHSISSTINLPNDVTEEEVYDIYMQAWLKGLKGVTIYRDGCRSGILVKEPTKQVEKGFTKRPEYLEATICRFQNNKEKWVAFIGTVDDYPYEIFTGLNDSEDGLLLPQSIDKGKIRKVKQEDGTSRYDFEYINKAGVKTIVEGLSRKFDSVYWNYAKLISGVLRHGMPITSVVDLVQTLDFDNEYINNWRNGVARAFKKFISDGTTTKNPCPDCGQNLVYENGCKLCKNCGHSACG